MDVSKVFPEFWVDSRAVGKGEICLRLFISIILLSIKIQSGIDNCPVAHPFGGVHFAYWKTFHTTPVLSNKRKETEVIYGKAALTLPRSRPLC